MPETPEERLGRLRYEIAGRASLFKKLVDTFGPEVLDVVKQDTIDSVKAQLAQNEIPERNLEAVISLLWNHVAPDLDYTIESQSAEHLELKVSRCMWAEEYRRLNASDIGYAFVCCYDFGFCQGLNPAIRFTRTKTLMQGDDCCDHTYDLAAEE